MAAKRAPLGSKIVGQAEGWRGSQKLSLEHLCSAVWEKGVQ